MATSFLDVLSRALRDALRGYQTFEFGIRPALEEQAFQRRERTYQQQQREWTEEQRQRAGAQSRFNFMLAMSRGDPQKAYAQFGDAYLRAAKEAFEVDIPTRERTVTEPGAVLTPEQRVTLPIQRREEGSLAGLARLAPRGTQEITVAPEVRGPAITRKVTELALPAEAQPAFRTVGDLARALGRELINPTLAGTSLESLPERFDPGALFKPLPSPPRVVAIIDQNTGQVIGVQELPPGVEPRFVTRTVQQGTTLQPYDSRTGKPVGAPVTYPPGVRPIAVPVRAGGAGGAADRLTPSQRNTIWHQSVNRATFEILGKRAGGLSLSVGPDGSLIPQMGAGQPPLTAEENTRIQARAEEIYQEAVARVTGKLPPPPPVRPGVGKAPTERAAGILAAWKTSRVPVPTEYWNALTALERAWLLRHGVRPATTGR